MQNGFHLVFKGKPFTYFLAYGKISRNVLANNRSKVRLYKV